LRVDTLFIPVTDLEKAVEWYTQTLEFKLNWRNDEDGYACVDGGVLPITLAKIPPDKEFVPFVMHHIIFLLLILRKHIGILPKKALKQAR
jgi:catechol 2,3-dioxygenase-like lactoylglutathione lyase family enzyme